MNGPQNRLATAFERFNGRKPTDGELRKILAKAAVVDDCNIDPILTLVLFNQAIEDSYARAALLPRAVEVASAKATAAIEAAALAVVAQIKAVGVPRGSSAASARHDGVGYKVAIAIGGVCCACAMLVGVLVWRSGYGAGFDELQGAQLLSYRRYACEVQQSMAHVEARRGEAHAAEEIRRLSAGC